MKRKKSNAQFWAVINTAKEISVENPRRDQPEKYKELKDALQALPDKNDRQKAFFVLMRHVLAKESPIQSLFALGNLVKKRGTAFGANAVLKAIDQGATLADLERAGIAKLKPVKNNSKVITIWRVGHNSLRQAADIFKEEGKNEFAQILEEHLWKSQLKRRQREELRQAREKQKPAEKELATAN